MMNHDAGRRLILELGEVLDEIRVPFFLMQGTALGAYRDKGFSRYEKDVDIGILYEHLAPVRAALVGYLLSEGYDVEQFVMPFTRPRTLVAFKRFGSHVVKADLVGMMPWKGQRFTYPPVRDYVREPYALVHEATILESYRPVEVWGRSWNVPERIEAYLEREYGPGWRTPKDDSESRTRVADYVTREQIPADYLERWG